MRSSGLDAIPDLWKATYDLVAQVPLGRVTTYGAVARALGDVVASRFVGLAMSMNDDIVRVPCRRVVQSDGRVGGYTGGGPRRKAALLKKEGIRVEGGVVQDMADRMFTDFVSDRPLKGLRRRQARLRGRVDVPSRDIDVRYVAGVDVAYRGEHSYAVAAVFDCATGEMVRHSVQEGDASFPYVPTYLAFRELPLVRPLMEDFPKGTVLMYDGNGLLHPEGMGIATHAGVAFAVPTIGVAKSYLCGERGRRLRRGVVPLSMDGEVVGYELSGCGSTRPVYVSVGSGIGPDQSLRIVKRFMLHRVPEPTRAAHILANRARGSTIHK